MQKIPRTCEETAPLLSLQSGLTTVDSSFLHGGPRQLVGQRVPALHLLALVLQTVYPVLQSVSLGMTP